MFSNTVHGKGEIRMKYFKVKHPTLGVSSTQGELKKICIGDLPTIYGYRYVKFLTVDERADALMDAPAGIIDEDSFIVAKCAKTAGLPARTTNILMFCNSMWAAMVRTIDGDSDKFADNYLEDLRLYDPRALVWGSIWKETQRRPGGTDGGLTNSQVWAVWGEPASLYSTAMAGMVKKDKSDEVCMYVLQDSIIGPCVVMRLRVVMM